ncbi:MAG: beta-ketoacyl synthase N-terminal-like domain-containing protein [Acidobacteriota bacterium]|nr:beta-ketoacyl synthase N-terminal-like domain-containing protein [Acidobacteriota bacterium]
MNHLPEDARNKGEGFMQENKKRIGIFGWGLVAPGAADIDEFEQNLSKPASMLTPFEGFGPNNFMVGNPKFDFADYKPWIDEHHEPRKFSQLDSKMGSMVKYAVGAFIQALGQNQGMHKLLQDLGSEAHVYVGTGIGEYPVQYDNSISYYKSWRRWNRFWCKPENNNTMAQYLDADPVKRAVIREQLGAPLPDPADIDPDDDNYEDVLEAWQAFWATHSDKLKQYLGELRRIEGESLEGDIDANKGHLIRKKVGARRKLNKTYACPKPPWSSVSSNLLWNIHNIPAAQIGMVGKITGPNLAPVAACSGFVTSLKMAENAIRLGDAKVCVVGTTDPKPHELTVSAFNDAKVISHVDEVSKPFTGLRGTHIAGGSCIWIVGDYEYLTGLGMKPLGLEIAGIGLTSDAHHIITPNKEGPQAAIHKALGQADVAPDRIDTWDMHATATPGDWTELQNALAVFPEGTSFTARKGSFGHGMSVCGGWELTAQHLGISTGHIYPVDLNHEEIHEAIQLYRNSLITHEGQDFEGSYAGKINMGVGGVNACVICKTWDAD